MGRGDRKTRKGKRAIRSYGNVRPHKVASKNAPKKSATKPLAKSAPAKKVAAAPKKKPA